MKKSILNFSVVVFAIGLLLLGKQSVQAQTTTTTQQKFLALPGFSPTGLYETDLVNYNLIYADMALNQPAQLRTIELAASNASAKKQITSDRLAGMPVETQEMIRNNPDKYEIVETNGAYGLTDSEPVPVFGPKEITKAQLSTMPEVTQNYIQQHPEKYKIVD